MRTKSFPLLISFLLFAILTFAQGEKDSSKTDAPQSYFKASIEYLNNSVYFGRKDSLVIPYLTPQLYYHFKSGIYIDANISYVTGESRVDVSTIGAGYSFKKKKWDGEISAEKYFYSNQSYNVKAETNGSFVGNLGYDVGFIEPSLSAFVNFSSKNDYGASLNLEHYFSLLRDHADITPSFAINASTQNSYAQYYQKRKYSKTRKGKTLGYTATANTLNTSGFKILDYEFSAPMEYTANRFTFSFSPTYAMPVNPATVLLTIKTSSGATGTRTFTENLSNSFFWTFGIAYKINGR